MASTSLVLRATAKIVSPHLPCCRLQGWFLRGVSKILPFSNFASCSRSRVISRGWTSSAADSLISTFPTCGLQVLSSSYCPAWGLTAKMRTITSTTKEAFGSIIENGDVNSVKDAPYSSRMDILSGASDGQHQSRIQDGRDGPQANAANARDMKLDVNLNDELGSGSATPFLRGKSSNRLARHFSESSVEDTRPLLRDAAKIRRAFTEEVGMSPPTRQHSFREDVEHAAAETYLISRLTFQLLRYLGLGYRWITRLMALGLYAGFLLPGFLQVGLQYFFSRHVHRSLVYGDQPRNRFDLYLPEETSTPKPVMIFVTGGAWIIGYKAWGAFLGLQLCERNIIVCCIDYRNFPQGTISDMVRDVSTGVGFIVNNISEYGGDPNRIYLCGQSAGSHMAACALVNQARIEIGQREGMLTWRCQQIKGFVGISGGYNLPRLVDHFHKRGLYRRIFLSIMEGEISLPLYSPEMAVQSDSFADGVCLLPPIYLLHGTGDYSIPCDASVKFGEALSSVGAKATIRLYPDKTHTDVFIQDPMRGGPDELFSDLLEIVHEDDEQARADDSLAPLRPRMLPEFLLQLARWVSPF